MSLRYTVATAMFQSSPAHGGRCYPVARKFDHRRTFQSSPAHGGRCYALHLRPMTHRKKEVSILTGPRGPVLQDAGTVPAFAIRFQSSPAHGGRCYHAVCAQRRDKTVSILTGPRGPVLRGPVCPSRSAWRFNPHRPTGAGATRAQAASSTPSSRFNPHRPTGAGATPRQSA